MLRTGRPELYPEVADAMLEAARDAEHLELLRGIGFRSVAIVPMVARGKTLGVVTLVSAESGRGFGEPDLRLAEELARRAAMAVDNAGLYEEARREIDERRRAQAELRASRDQLEVVLRGVAPRPASSWMPPCGRWWWGSRSSTRRGGRSLWGTCRVGGPSPARRGPRRCCASASWQRARSVGR